MNPNQALWEKGDFTRVASSMRGSGEALVDRIGVTKGLKVLDLGCGDGTTAVPAARLGADVLGVDIARNLVEAGNLRATEAGLPNLSFQQGDACDLGELEGQPFDLVPSRFEDLPGLELRLHPTDRWPSATQFPEQFPVNARARLDFFHGLLEGVALLVPRIPH